MSVQVGSILALDVGEKRIGVAIASPVARIAQPLTTLENNDTVIERLRDICATEGVTQLVAGLPRGLDGQTTAQTTYAEDFAHTLAAALALPLQLIDEAVTSRQAEAELTARGKAFSKGDIDALAAVYILDDYLSEMR